MNLYITGERFYKVSEILRDDKNIDPSCQMYFFFTFHLGADFYMQDQEIELVFCGFGRATSERYCLRMNEAHIILKE